MPISEASKSVAMIIYVEFYDTIYECVCVCVCVCVGGVIFNKD